MRFANKYELFEAVTSGRVETFFAKDLASGERVLLHIFEAPEKRPDQPTVIWVLESFRNVAPEPPGLVLETGRYSGTTYAYLVTKLPDNAALQRWTQSYDSNVKEAREIAIPSEAPPPVSADIRKNLSPPLDRPVEPSTPTTSAKPPDDFTAAFSGSASPAAPPSEANTASATALDAITSGPAETAPKRAPGEFTRQFFSGLHELPEERGPQASGKSSREVGAPAKPEAPPLQTGTQAAAKAEATQPQPPKQTPSGGGLTGSSAPAAQDSGGFTALFRSDFKSEPKATSESHGPPTKSADSKGGDFTDFFRGPFDGERPAETPEILPKLPDTTQRNAPGEFTKVFGSGKSSALAGPPPIHSPVGDFSRQDEAAGSTQIFSGAGQPAVAPPTNAPLQTWAPVAQKSEMSPLSKEAAWTAPPLRPSPPVTPSIEPIPQTPTVSSTLREPEPKMPAGATHVFSVVRPPLSSPPPPPAGPSEYTRIISGGTSGITPAEKVPIVSPPPPKFSPPAVPPPPKAPPPGIKASKPKTPYLPLVIILSVLSIVAILLVVYFAIRH